LPLLKFESDLIYAPCRNGKMITASHSPVNIVMTERPGQLLHLDTIGPSRVRSMGGKWYVLVIFDYYSRYSWVFFLESKDEVFKHFRSIALRLDNEHPNCLKAIYNDNGTEFRNDSFDQFCLERGVCDRTPIKKQGFVSQDSTGGFSMKRECANTHISIQYHDI
jgi:hypothetical protein